MAASRWKRFAFFDRQNLTLNDAVVADLIPNRGILAIDKGDAVSMVVSTAGLPSDFILRSKSLDDATQTQTQNPSTAAMWESLTACMAPHETSIGTVTLSSQAQLSSGVQKEGLVLLFLASQESDRVHCVDVTMRCNLRTTTSTSTASTSEPQHPQGDDEGTSLDGWRGYWTPFANTTMTHQDRIVAEHTGNDTIVALATCRSKDKLWVACLSKSNLVLYQDPHLDLSCRIPLVTNALTNTVAYRPSTPWNAGSALCMDLHDSGLIAVGTDHGAVHIYALQKEILKSVLTIAAPAPHQQVTCVQWSIGANTNLFVVYSGRSGQHSRGICCFDLGRHSTSLSTLARHDLDSRSIPSNRLCDASHPHLLVARADGLYMYSCTQKLSVAPLNGIKLVLSHIAPSYALVASTDSKSGRDALDVYDANNKLVAFHVLLSPAHKALSAVGIQGPYRSSAFIWTVSFVCVCVCVCMFPICIMIHDTVLTHVQNTPAS